MLDEQRTSRHDKAKVLLGYIIIGLVTWLCLGAFWLFGISPANNRTELHDHFVLTLALIQPILVAHAIVFLARPRIGFIARLLIFLAVFKLLTASELMSEWVQRTNFDGFTAITEFHTSVFSTLGAFAGFFLLQRFAPSVTGLRVPAQGPQEQFSLGSILIWLACIGVLIRNPSDYLDFLDVPAVAYLIVFGVYFIATIVVIYPISLYLVHARSFFVSALVPFSLIPAVALVVVCIYSHFSGVQSRKLLAIVTCPAFTVIALAIWILGLRMANGNDSEFDSSLEAERPTKLTMLGNRFNRTAIAITACLWVYVGGLAIINIGFSHHPNRDFNLLLTSDVLRHHLESAYDPNVVAAVSAKTKSDNLVRIVNELNRHGVNPDDNFIHRIAMISKPRRWSLDYSLQLWTFDDLAFGNNQYQRELGITQAEIDALPAHDPFSWLNELRPANSKGLSWLHSTQFLPTHLDEGVSPKKVYAKFYRLNHRILELMSETGSWQECEFELATKYCKSKQPVFEAIRQAANSKFLFEPIVIGLERRTKAVEFAKEMLTIDCNYQLGLGNIDRVIENCTALMKIIELMQSYPAESGYLRAEHSLRVKTLGMILRTLDHDKCTSKHSIQLQRLVNEQSIFLDLDQKRFAQKQLIDLVEFSEAEFERYEEKFIGNSFLFRSKFVDWQSFVDFELKRGQYLETLFHETKNFSANYGFWQTKERQNLARAVKPKPNQFNAAIATNLRGPKYKAKTISQSRMENAKWSVDFFFTAQADIRMYQIVIALKLYHREHGDYPEALSELEPRFIKQLPDDPFANQAFRYRKPKDDPEREFVLYSVNLNQVDDGGWFNSPDDDYIWVEREYSLLKLLTRP